jgi:hypothetical protein
VRFGMPHLYANPGDLSEQRAIREQLDLMRAAEDLDFDLRGRFRCDRLSGTARASIDLRLHGHPLLDPAPCPQDLYCQTREKP